MVRPKRNLPAPDCRNSPAALAAARTWLGAAVCAALVLATFAAYWPVRSNEFISLDDPDYVTENPHLRGGLTGDNVAWAFGSSRAANWHPLTWLAHLLDVQLFGFDAGWHHLTSLALHALSAVLLFLVLRRLTGALWRSAAVGALFALHPLHVESVAWIAERKDVLSGCFFMLVLWAYAVYAARPGLVRYAAVVVLLALGLAAKPMLVTLPFVLLLLDFWPLGRLGLRPLGPGTAGVGPLLLEKVPLFVLAGASSVVTFLVQSAGGAVTSTSMVSWTERLANVPTAYVLYLWKTLWPAHLAIYYPLPDAPNWPLVGGAALVLLLLTALALLTIRRRPYLAVGWFWYLGTLLPVVGLVQVGVQRMADRYSYLPLVGIFIAVVWGLGDLAAGRRGRAIVAAGALAAALVALALVTRSQVGVWHDNIRLFEHATNVAPNNLLAENQLGNALSAQGRLAEAIIHFRKAVAMGRYPDAQNNLGSALAAEGHVDEAIPHWREALQGNPRLGSAETNLAFALLYQGHSGEALDHARRAVAATADLAEAHLSLARTLEAVGQPAEARSEYVRARDLARSTGKDALAETIDRSLQHLPPAKTMPGRQP